MKLNVILNGSNLAILLTVEVSEECLHVEINTYSLSFWLEGDIQKLFGAVEKNFPDDSILSKNESRDLQNSIEWQKARMFGNHGAIADGTDDLGSLFHVKWLSVRFPFCAFILYT